MGILTDDPTWVENVTQIEDGDSAWGGPGKPINTPFQNLADRTAFLKRESGNSSIALLEALSQIGDLAKELKTIGVDSDKLLITVSEIIAQTGSLAKAINTIRNQVLNQGSVFIKNKYVIDGGSNGFKLAKSSARLLDLSYDGTVGTNSSEAYINGIIVS